MQQREIARVRQFFAGPHAFAVRGKRVIEGFARIALGVVYVHPVQVLQLGVDSRPQIGTAIGGAELAKKSRPLIAILVSSNRRSVSLLILPAASNDGQENETQPSYFLHYLKITSDGHIDAAKRRPS